MGLRALNSDKLTTMVIRDRIDEAQKNLGRKRRKLGRKEEALRDRERYLKRLIDRRHKLRQEGASNERLERLALEIQAVKEQIEAHERRIDALRDALSRLRSLLRRLRRKWRSNRVVVEPGRPHWGGAQDILENEVDPVADRMGHYETSNKRTETYGNPGSDHHISQVNASAKDYSPGVAFAVAVAKALGVGYRGYWDDYKLYYIRRAGHTFRVQIIAANHGTGPHVHVGIELIS